MTDIIDYNREMLNRHNMGQSFFQTSRCDPLEGFSFDARSIAGHSYPNDHEHDSIGDDGAENLTLRLRLGSHLALHIRHQLEQQKGYTSTVGIASSKLLSKLVGNLNKPKGQTTLMPPLGALDNGTGNAQAFIDGHEIGKVPGIGFKLAQKLREFILQKPADFATGLGYGETKEKILVADLRHHPEIDPEMLGRLLGGPGSPHGIGHTVWCLLHGIDDTEVRQAKAVPSQISIEDSYIRLDTMPELLRELNALAKSLVTRMRIDLLGDCNDGFDEQKADAGDTATAQPASKVMPKKWLAHPKTLRLTTRPRPPLQPDGTRLRSFKRISHSAPLPNFIFCLSESVDAVAEKLVQGTLITMFRRLHPEKSGWNLSLVNLAVTNMAETAGESRTANGRDIGGMFRRQDDVLKDFRVTDATSGLAEAMGGSTDDDVNVRSGTGLTGGIEISNDDGSWDEDDGVSEDDERCGHCGARMPAFAIVAHRRFHSPTLP